MSRASIVMLVAIGAAAFVVPAATHAGTAPKLRLVTVQPLVVRGESFRPHERVVVTAMTPSGAKRVAVRATSRGRFGATLELRNQPCGDAFAVRALGRRGSRAWVDVPSRPCVPPPIR
jgi:hypothetical protein